MPYSHVEVEAAIRGLSEAFKEAERRGSWSWLADEFYHEDCVYTCPYGGTMLVVANGRAYLNTAWWISTMPGLALSLVVLAVGRFGDQVRDALDPRSASRF